MQKIKNDIIYSKLALLSDDELLKAGWFETKLSIKNTEEHYKLNIFGHDLSCFNNNDNELILFSTGSYAPIHEGHIFSWISSIEVALKNNFDVKLFLISPSHDDYILTKSKEHKNYDIFTRIKLIEDALISFFYKYPQYFCYQNLFKIDLFESIHSSVAINFSEVLEYILISIEKFSLTKIKIGYVFGSDNFDFYKPFLGETSFLSFCVNRGKVNLENKINANNLFFIENLNIDAAKISSTQLRDSFEINNETPKGTQYFVREDCNFAIQHWVKKYPQFKKILITEYNLFNKSLFNLIKQTFPQLTTINSSLKNHIEILKKISQNNTILNLDICTNNIHEINQYSLNYSRVFEKSSIQRYSDKFSCRDGLENNLPINQENCIFVDDDICSGFTLKNINKIVINNNSKITKTISLTEEEFNINSNNKYDCFDVIDTRDFLLGTYFGGLVCNINGVNKRFPYFQPFVNLKYRAKINNVKKFQIKILQLNLSFFKKCDFLKKDDLFISLDELTYDKHEDIHDFLLFMINWTKNHII